MTESLREIHRSCFVIMPFGRKAVGERIVDFDWLYDRIYRSAAKIQLDGGKFLRACRADREPAPGIAYTRMLLLLSSARIAMADVTGGNPNVAFELGFRKGVRRSGSVIVAQEGTAVPFNLAGLQRLDYQYRPRAQAYRTELISRLREFLRQALPGTNRHTPLAKATEEISSQMGTDDGPTLLGELVSGAEASLINNDLRTAIVSYQRALEIKPHNLFLHQRLGLLHSDAEDFPAAAQHFQEAGQIARGYPDAHRGHGLVQQSIWMGRGCPQGIPTGEESLRRALKLDPDDYGVATSLGDLYMKQGRLPESLQILERFREYPTGAPRAFDKLLQVEHVVNDGTLIELNPRHTTLLARLGGRIEIVNAPTRALERKAITSTLATKGITIGKLTTHHVGETTIALGTVKQGTARAMEKLMDLHKTEVLGRKVMFSEGIGSTLLSELSSGMLRDERVAGGPSRGGRWRGV